jgi:hypothetical protein
MKVKFMLAVVFASYLVAASACSNKKSNTVKAAEVVQTEAPAVQESVSSNTPTFVDEKFNAAFQKYLQLKDLLVKGNDEMAKVVAKEVVGSFKQTTFEEVTKQVGLIANATNLNEQRAGFVLLNEVLVEAVKKQKVATGVVYLSYCPMANDNNGAYWLSAEKEIRNPYFGDKMLKCGEMREEIVSQ